ncbi:MAG: ATP-binding cassette domain-containing protein [Ruminococcus sp.]|nr:ATP-binding cassette domain-containing protein [Ruminococcus sp.]
MEYIIQSDGLAKYYKNFKALDGVSVHVPKGAIYGFVGRNGAGKTTFIRILSGVAFKTGGSFEIKGFKDTDPRLREARKIMGAVVETPSIYLDMTAEENIRQQCRILGKDFSCVKGILELVGLKDTGKKLAKDFSLGMRQRLGIAFSLVNDPEFLILDEPINGLDPQGIIEVRELLTRLNKERGMTILISSHILDELSKLATHYGFIERGKIIKEMSAEEIDHVCRHIVEVTVSDTKVLADVLGEMNVDFRITSDTEAEIYSEITVTPLVLRLHEKGCEVIKLSEHHESLESFFINLVGGAMND